VSKAPSIRDADLLEHLDWDTAHFEIPVARIPSPSLSDDELDQALQQAQESGVELVYWATHSERKVPASLLHRHGGNLVDRKAVFRARLADLPAPQFIPGRDDVVILETAPGPASEALLALAVEAGRFSRFHVDPNIPCGKFDALYRIWMERSMRRELADVVLVACRAADPRKPLGMITLSMKRGESMTGLIAVHGAARGRGIGTRLIAAANQIRRQRGVIELSVVTQLANEPACRLYQRAGYRLAEVSHFYHFWPQIRHPWSIVHIP
jgi:dTDP-4-amino-4,6-dideoxy-D-galactose acyltransferase